MRHLVFALLFVMTALPAAAQLPQRSLLVELRQIEDGQTGYVVGTRPQAPLLPQQQLQVRNGAQAVVSMGQAIPMQWVQSVVAHSASLAASGVSASSQGGGVTQALTWLRAGQQFIVKPSWPGGQRPVSVDIEVQTAAVDPRPGADLPTQHSSELATTVLAPLGAWVTIARSGQSAPRGSYSSEAATQRPRLLQLRVTAP